MDQQSVYVGIDVSKAALDVAVYPAGPGWQVENTQEGIDLLAGQLGDVAPALIVVEATGGFEAPLVGVLADRGLPIVVVNPRQVRDFAKATGKLAKTDVLDAQVLAEFAARIRPEVRPLPDAETQALKALLARRRQ